MHSSTSSQFFLKYKNSVQNKWTARNNIRNGNGVDQKGWNLHEELSEIREQESSKPLVAYESNTRMLYPRIKVFQLMSFDRWIPLHWSNTDKSESNRSKVWKLNSTCEIRFPGNLIVAWWNDTASIQLWCTWTCFNKWKGHKCLEEINFNGFTRY